jgi:hypothetical protein
MTRRLKGAAGNLSLPKVAEFAGIMDSTLEKKDTQTARKHMPLLETELDRVFESIRQWGKSKNRSYSL